jgi:NAD(P)-dependent dehydrogenase (short-subunit alcohol dehydrogenase family)
MTAHLTILTGASRGMGLAMAHQLLDAGHDLVCIARRSNDELARHAAQSGRACEQWPLDLESGTAAAATLATWLTRVAPTAYASATLINNAGIVPHIAPIPDIPSDDLVRAMRVDLEAPMLLTSAFLRATAGWSGPRKVLNISSGMGRRAMALAPGVIDTDMQVQLRSADAAQFPDRGNFVGLKDKGVLMSPADAAAKVLAYLARPDFGSVPVADVRDA